MLKYFKESARSQGCKIFVISIGYGYPSVWYQIQCELQIAFVNKYFQTKFKYDTKTTSYIGPGIIMHGL